MQVKFYPLPTVFLLAVVLLLTACGSGASLQYGSEPADSGSTQETTVTSDGPAVTDADGIEIGFTNDGHPYRGNPDAPVVIEEYSDFQCPFCSSFSAETLPQLLENEIANGEAMLIFYDFPLESIHPQARSAANAARCAAAQSIEGYWEMHDTLFASAQEWSVENPVPVFVGYAENLGLDSAEFESCMSANTYDADIQSDIDRALSLEITSTPSFRLNGQKLRGAQPYEAFVSAISIVKEGGTIEVAENEAQPSDELPLVAPQVAPTPSTIPTANIAYAMGDPDAPVQIVEFTDYQCPYCQRHATETLPLMISEYIETGEVYYMVKDLPLESIHPEARAAANAARCAGEQDAYMEMHDALFESQQAWSGKGTGTSAEFVNIANKMGLDSVEFEACITENRYDEAVQGNLVEALTLGASSTPFFYLNGYPISGAIPYDMFEYAIGLAKTDSLASAYEVPEPDVTNSFAVGDPNAPVTIIEYTDFQCPYCSRHFQETYPQIKANYIDTGQVYYIFKDFPLTNIHPQAQISAEAARCAGDQDAYLEMHDILFGRQSEWNGRTDAAEIFVEYADELGLNTDTFRTCVESGTYTAAVQADLNEGVQRGINGTPAFVINGYSMSGAQPYSVFAEAIEQMLAEAGQS